MPFSLFATDGMWRHWYCIAFHICCCCCKATAAPFALDPQSAMDKPLAGEILLSKEQYAEQAQVNFRNARDAYNKQKSKTQKVVHIYWIAKCLPYRPHKSLPCLLACLPALRCTTLHCLPTNCRLNDLPPLQTPRPMEFCQCLEGYFPLCASSTWEQRKQWWWISNETGTFCFGSWSRSWLWEEGHTDGWLYAAGQRKFRISACSLRCSKSEGAKIFDVRDIKYEYREVRSRWKNILRVYVRKGWPSNGTTTTTKL